MRLFAAIVVLLATAPVAAADTLARRTPAVGPAFAGGEVIWGEEGRGGAVRLMAGTAGGRPRVVHRIPAATAPDTERGFGGVPATFAASPTRFAALVYTATHFAEDFDSFSSTYTNAVVSGPLGAPASIIAGCIPRRGDDGCRDADCHRVDGVDVDRDRIAVLETRGCDQGPSARLTVHGPAGARTIGTDLPAGARAPTRAGRYVAWIDYSFKTLVVRDLATGGDALRLRAADLNARGFEALALRPNGTVAFTFSGPRDRRGMRLGWTNPREPEVRPLDRHATYGDIALARGRVLYERVLSERRFTGELVLRRLRSGRGRVLAHFPERRRRVGDLDLDATRATWATRPMGLGCEPRPRGPGRIGVRDL